MADGINLKEYLVSLGFDVDEPSRQKMLSAVREGTFQANILFEALNKAVAAFGSVMFKTADQLNDLYWESHRIKETVGNIQAFEAAAAETGSTAEAAGTSLTSFFKAIRFNPGLDELARSYSHVSDAQWKMMGTSQRLLATVHGMQNLPPWVQSQYMSLLGIDFNTWQSIQSGEFEQHLQRFQELQKRAGLDPQVAAENAKKFVNVMTDFSNDLEIIWEKIQGNVVNGGGSALQKLLKWMEDHSSEIANAVTKLSDVVLDFVNNGLNKLLKDPDVEKGFQDFIHNVTDLASRLDDLARKFDKIWHFFTDPVDANWFAKYIFGQHNNMTDPPVQPRLPRDPSGRSAWQQVMPTWLGGKDASSGTAAPDNRNWWQRNAPSWAGGKPAPGSSVPMSKTTGGMSRAETEAYIRQSAINHGIDPNVAVAVARSEGLNKYAGDYGTSFGPFQLHYGGSGIPGMNSRGLGDAFTKATGLDARNPATVRQQIDYAMEQVRKGGWSPWHGAARVGIYGYAGVGPAPSHAALSTFLGVTPAQAAEVLKRFPVGGRAGSLSPFFDTGSLGAFSPTAHTIDNSTQNTPTLNQKTTINILGGDEGGEVGARIARAQSRHNDRLLRDFQSVAVG